MTKSAKPAVGATPAVSEGAKPAAPKKRKTAKKMKDMSLAEFIDLANQLQAAMQHVPRSAPGARKKAPGKKRAKVEEKAPTKAAV